MDKLEEHLVQWLLDKRNCSCWLGSEDSSKDNSIYDGKDGLTKGAILKEIATKMKNAINLDCNPSQIEQKIRNFIADFKVAAESHCNTGKGIEQRDGVESFKKLMKLQLKYYFDFVTCFVTTSIN